MKTIGIFQAKTHLSEIVKSGQEVCLTNRGEEVAVIVPISQYRQNKTKSAWMEFKELKKRIPLGDSKTIKQWINEGRR